MVGENDCRKSYVIINKEEANEKFRKYLNFGKRLIIIAICSRRFQHFGQSMAINSNGVYIFMTETCFGARAIKLLR